MNDITLAHAIEQYETILEQLAASFLAVSRMGNYNLSSQLLSSAHSVMTEVIRLIGYPKASRIWAAAWECHPPDGKNYLEKGKEKP